MKMQEILNEVLASPYKYSIQEPIKGTFKAWFESAGSEYLYTMKLDTQYFKDGTVAVNGYVRFTDRRGRIKVTGEGDAFKIMATVIDITKKLASNPLIAWHFLEEEINEDTFDDMEEQGLIPKKIKILEFQAVSEEPSRVKLYRRITKSLSGYNVFEPKVGVFYLIVDTLLNKKQEIIKS